MPPIDETPPGERATWRDLDAHALRTARAEFQHALGEISVGGVARLWHERTKLRVVTTGAELRAWFAETKQRL